VPGFYILQSSNIFLQIIFKTFFGYKSFYELQQDGFFFLVQFIDNIVEKNI